MRATSFRVRDGKVRNLAGHLERLGLSEAESQRLRTELRQRVHDAAASGAHAINPIIWADTGSWTIDVRPDRTIKSHIIMDAHPHNDERRQPQVKGPDLMWLSTRMNITKGRGADEGLLKAPSGRIIEGIYAHLIALHGNKVAVSTHPRTLRSITAAQVIPYLQQCGMTVVERTEGFTLQELHEAEVWDLNAFSGIRLVTAWAEYGDVIDIPAGRAAAAQVPTSEEVNRWLWEQADVV